MMDLVLRLREARRLSGLSQREAAKKSGVGEKTLSSFEAGARAVSIKVVQLRRLLATYGITESEFFSEEFERRAIENSVTLPGRGATSTYAARLFEALAALDARGIDEAINAVEKFAATRKGSRS